MAMELSGDKALNSAAEDRLGFGATAEAIAAALLRQSVVDGLVVGIEGRWGSGKSSLLNMTVAALRHADEGAAPEIVEFKPWLIGDRDSLLLALFTELAIAADAIEERAGDPVGRRQRELGDIGKRVVGFAAQLGSVGTLAKAAGLLIPGAAAAGELIEGIAKAANGAQGQRSIAKEKAELRERLKGLNRRIVITIDDVDRLEPSEVVEILRLVRSVADFPNVIYVLCYDPEIVSHSIQVAAQVENGRAYIEKIVQVPISVPRPEAFDLRRWFAEEINALPHQYDEAGGWKARLTGVIDVEGNRYLLTPRHVVRCLDGIRFFWGALQDQVDLGDLVWLHLVKVGNSKLYDWIGRYLLETAAHMPGFASITDEEKRDARKQLDKALRADAAKFKHARYRLSEFLPGISEGMGLGGEDDTGVHVDVSQEDTARAVQGARLASPDHYRLYFAVEQPRNSPRLKDFTDLMAALDDSAARTSTLLDAWQRDLLSTGATKADVMLSRVINASGLLVRPERSQNLLVAMADRLDELVKTRPDGLSDPQIWIEGRRALRTLLPNLGSRRAEALSSMFRGRALDWLTTILRGEIFAHGRVEGHRRGNKLLESDELDSVSAAMVDRYRHLKLSQLKTMRRPVNALFAWYQAGDSEGVKAMLAAKSKSDSGFLTVLELMSGRISSSSRGEYAALNASTLCYFMDYDQARKRTEALAGGARSLTTRKRATALMQQFIYGEAR